MPSEKLSPADLNFLPGLEIWLEVGTKNPQVLGYKGDFSECLREV